MLQLLHSPYLTLEVSKRFLCKLACVCLKEICRLLNMETKSGCCCNWIPASSLDYACQVEESPILMSSPSSTHSHMPPLTAFYPSAFNMGLQLLPSSERRKSQCSDGRRRGIPQLCIPPPSIHILMLILPTTWTWGLRREHQESG